MNRIEDRSKEPENGKRNAWWKYVVSALLVVHLTAVFAPPFWRATQTPVGGRSPVATELRDVLEPYVNLMFLDHGYAFFAPGPGPSHLIRFRVEHDDGSPAVEHVFPDLDRHWPRLLYHRHFMLAEQLHSDYVSRYPPNRPEREPDEPTDVWERRLTDWEIESSRWKFARDRYDTKWKSFENHLLKHYGGDRVSMVRVEHRLPSPDPSSGLIDLNDKDLYVDLSEFPPSENLAPLPNPAPGVRVPLRPLTPLESPPLEELP
jgi:hypothetical protein